MVANVSDSWISPAFPRKLKDNEVHIWRSKLEQPDVHIREFASVLSEEERTRAAGFRFERHKKRFIIGRAVLRKILGFYLNTEPGQLRFYYGSEGKPYVAQRFCEAAIQFNLAHSKEFALYAFTVKRRIGVDLEYIRRIPDVERMAARFFFKGKNFRLLTDNEKLDMFFNRWTRTEAYAKAVGTGLTQSFDEFDASLTREPAFPPNWFITSFTPAPGYTASLVVEGHKCVPHYFVFAETALCTPWNRSIWNQERKVASNRSMDLLCTPNDRSISHPFTGFGQFLHILNGDRWIFSATGSSNS